MSNTITIEGNIGNEPELTYTQSGTACLRFSVADSKSRKNKSTEEWETINTTWWRITLWEGQAELMAEKLSKGAKVMVTGRAILREFETRDGGKGQSLEVDYAKVALVPRPDRDAAPKPAPRDVWADQPADTTEVPF